MTTACMPLPYSFMILYFIELICPIDRHCEDEVDEVEPSCFLPHATDIIASSHSSTTDSNMLSSITLQWQVTQKENPDLKYCEGSRRWEVRLLKYSNVDDIPGDYEVVSPTDDQPPSTNWIKAPGRSTTYNFTQGDLFTSYFYSFQVKHLEKKIPVDVSPKQFASQVHYFGKQCKQEN